MEIALRIKMNEKLFLRNPEQSVLGRKIVKHGLELINKIGFEDFTFKKLATNINTTEASIYRYFENKHKLLVYLLAWYWNYIEYKVMYSTNNIKDAHEKIKQIIKILIGTDLFNMPDDFIDERLAGKLAMVEGSKVYLTRHVDEDNQSRLFKPYKDLCNRIAEVILELKPKYKFPHSLASCLVETAHSQKFFMYHLPSLTDFGNQKNDKKLMMFLESLVFESIS
jgi:AcrR family transcriptional regulator